MQCPKCNAKCNENAVKCYNCGYDLAEDDFITNLDKVVPTPKSKKKCFSFKNIFKKKDKLPIGKEKKRLIVIVGILSLLVIILAVIFIVILNSNEGKTMFDRIEIGRDITYVESKVEVSFEEESGYAAISNIAEFDSIFESDKLLKFDGINLPEWAICLNYAEDNSVESANFYNFDALEKSWKGVKTTQKFGPTTIEDGMTSKSVSRAMGFKPYLTRKSLDNTTTEYYRYHFVDTETNNDVIYNLIVEYSDIKGKVVNYYANEIDYQSFFLKIN